MVYEELKKIANPYHIVTQLSPNEFIGREEETKYITSMLNDYKGGARLTNILVSGEKSIGKSTLLKKYKTILQDYNFVVFEYEISTDINRIVDEFEVFKLLIGELFEKYAPTEDNFFDPLQSEIWFKLTSCDYKHSSNFMKRELRFPTKYASRMNGNKEILSFQELRYDFEKIMNQLTSSKMGFSGLALIIDEFQELSRNVLLLEILRQITEAFPNILIIGAGIPPFIDNKGFEKIARSSKVQWLKNFSRRETLDLIFKPLQCWGRFTRHEVENCFDKRSIFEITKRSIGNPLHVLKLCQSMFDHFQKEPSSKYIQLSSQVMEDVMEYYSTLSSKHKIIKNSLSTSSKDQLKAFGFLYKYEGYTLRAAILSELAFEPIIGEKEEKIKIKFIDSFKDIWDFQLFKFTGDVNSLDEVESMSSDRLASVQYEFIGDIIDKLYASYYYEALSGDELHHYSERIFEDHLALKLGDLLGNRIIQSFNKENIVMDLSFQRIEHLSEKDIMRPEHIEKDFQWLLKNTSDLEKHKDKNEKLLEICKQYNLNLPSLYLHSFGFGGYIIMFSEIIIRNKTRRLVNFYPLEGEMVSSDKIKAEIINYAEYISEPLDNYMVKINWIQLLWIPKQPMIFIFQVDINKEYDHLLNEVKKRNFDNAVIIAKQIFEEDMLIRYKEKKIYSYVPSTNNYAFCLININSLEKAKELLEETKGNYLLSQVNLAYVHYLEGNRSSSLEILKKIYRKKLGEDEEIFAIHLAINHSKLLSANKIVEQLTIYEIVNYNLALINAQDKAEQSIINSFLKKVTITEKNKFIRKRVKNWIKYYYGDVKQALTDSDTLLKEVVDVDYLSNDIAKDIEIFKQECN